MNPIFVKHFLVTFTEISHFVKQVSLEFMSHAKLPHDYDGVGSKFLYKLQTKMSLHRTKMLLKSLFWVCSYSSISLKKMSEIVDLAQMKKENKNKPNNITTSHTHNYIK